MAEDKTTSPQEDSGTAPDIPADERYRYIGFEVFPKRVKKFWKSDTEQAEHLGKVREKGGKFTPLSRDNSIVAVGELSLGERLVLTFSSVLLVVAPFLPWFTFTRGGERFSYSGLQMVTEAGTVMNFFSLGPGLLTTSFILLVALMVLGVAFGVATLVFLYTGRQRNTDAYVIRLRRILALHYIPIVGWVVFFSITAAPTVIPFAASLGLNEVEDSLNIASLATSSSFGLWVPFAVLWVNAIKGNDL
jgi:hypothetical protein